MLLDSFSEKYPFSKLLVYVYNDYFNVYYELKDFPKAIEYIDEMLTLGGEQLNSSSAMQLRLARAKMFLAGTALHQFNSSDETSRARQQAYVGLEDLAKAQKPSLLSDTDWDIHKNQIAPIFEAVVDRFPPVTSSFGVTPPKLLDKSTQSNWLLAHAPCVG